MDCLLEQMMNISSLFQLLILKTHILSLIYLWYTIQLYILRQITPWALHAWFKPKKEMKRRSEEIEMRGMREMEFFEKMSGP